MKDDCVRSCLIELKSFLLSKLNIDPIHRVLMFLPLFAGLPALLAKGARLLIGRSAQGFNSENIHMEDEVKDQEDEVEDERQLKSAKRGSKREQAHRRMTHGWDDAHKHLSQCRVTHHYKCAQTREKGDV